jgi:hypothetical protein
MTSQQVPAEGLTKGLTLKGIRGKANEAVLRIMRLLRLLR